MGIPKKGSRNLLVDGKTFRYIIRHHGCSDPWCRCGKEQQVTVQEKKSSPGRVLQLIQATAFTITPTMLRDKVREAIEKGWDPSSRGGPLRLTWE